MTFRFATLVLLTCLLPLGAAERLPADSRWFLHLDLQALRASQAGPWIEARLAEPQTAARIQLLTAMTGLKPGDLRAVTVCGAQGGETTALVLVRGTFDAERLATLARAADDYRAIPSGARTIHTWKDKAKTVAGCLIAPDLLALAQDVERIRLAIRLHDDPGAPVAAFALPAAWAGQGLLTGAAERLGDLLAGQPASAMFGNVRSCAVRLAESGSDLGLDLQTTALNEAAAQQMVDAGRGLIALVLMQQSTDLDPALVGAITTATIERSAAQVTVRTSLPMADVLRLADQKAGR